MFVTTIKPPSKKTLDRYGLTLEDYGDLLVSCNGACPVCNRVPDSRKLVIDHEHVKGWRKLSKKARKGFVRGLLCNICNWQFLRKGLTLSLSQGITRYLSDYVQRKTSNQQVADNEGTVKVAA